jgi:hypothetical protein
MQVEAEDPASDSLEERVSPTDLCVLEDHFRPGISADQRKGEFCSMGKIGFACAGVAQFEREWSLQAASLTEDIHRIVRHDREPVAREEGLPRWNALRQP